jgi:hypothetical protein
MDSFVLVEKGVIVEAREAERGIPWWSFTKTITAGAALVLVLIRDLSKKYIH